MYNYGPCIRVTLTSASVLDEPELLCHHGYEDTLPLFVVLLHAESEINF